jgi:hypothetical protein
LFPRSLDLLAAPLELEEEDDEGRSDSAEG